MILVLLLLAGFCFAPLVMLCFEKTGMDFGNEVKSDDERKVKVTYDYFK